VRLNIRGHYFWVETTLVVPSISETETQEEKQFLEEISRNLQLDSFPATKPLKAKRGSLDEIKEKSSSGSAIPSFAHPDSNKPIVPLTVISPSVLEKPKESTQSFVTNLNQDTPSFRTTAAPVNPSQFLTTMTSTPISFSSSTKIEQNESSSSDNDNNNILSKTQDQRILHVSPLSQTEPEVLTSFGIDTLRTNSQNDVVSPQFSANLLTSPNIFTSPYGATQFNIGGNLSGFPILFSQHTGIC